ncbi:MAG: hypothetical protein ACI8PZ_002158 [Myxococcota bacterium]|jgi:hypothetical protein
MRARASLTARGPVGARAAICGAHPHDTHLTARARLRWVSPSGRPVRPRRRLRPPDVIDRHPPAHGSEAWPESALTDGVCRPPALRLPLAAPLHHGDLDLELTRPLRHEDCPCATQRVAGNLGSHLAGALGLVPPGDHRRPAGYPTEPQPRADMRHRAAVAIVDQHDLRQLQRELIELLPRNNSPHRAEQSHAREHHQADVCSERHCNPGQGSTNHRKECTGSADLSRREPFQPVVADRSPPWSTMHYSSLRRRSSNEPYSGGPWR